MKAMMTKTNPAFKRMQPLPFLRTDVQHRAGWAARSLAQVLPLAGSLPVAVVGVARVVVKPGFGIQTAT